MTEYPIKVRWSNDSAALNKFLTREIQPLKGTPQDQRDITGSELETIATAVCDREKTNIVIHDEQERELVVAQLRSFTNGIGHPSFGGKWATRGMQQAVKRVISEIENA